MEQKISKATFGRLPVYIEYIKSCPDEYTSAAKIASGLGLGEVQVRKDLNKVCGEGKPKIGYHKETLLNSISEAMGVHNFTPAVIVGAGKLGKALMGYTGFNDFGLVITAAFDINTSDETVLPMSKLKEYCSRNNIKIGILTVNKESAQQVADEMTQAGITAVWNFAPVNIKVPDNVKVKNENLALSLAYLKSVNK